VESFPTDCKKMEPFLPTSQPQSFLHETAEWTGKHHAPHVTLLPTSPGK
jgi:hypothetical protein